MIELQRTSPPAAPGPAVVVLAGELDVASASGVRARLGAATGGRSSTVVIDPSRVSFVDVSGLRELVSARARLLAGGRVVPVRSPSPAVLRLLRWTSAHEALVPAAVPAAGARASAAPLRGAAAPDALPVSA